MREGFFGHGRCRLVRFTCFDTTTGYFGLTTYIETDKTEDVTVTLVSKDTTVTPKTLQNIFAAACRHAILKTKQHEINANNYPWNSSSLTVLVR